MTVFVPSMARLVQAAADHLEHELLPTLEGYHRYQTRVCVNVLRIVQRQAEQGAVLEAAEWARLSELLQSCEALPALNDVLVGQLDDGSLPLDAPGLVPHLQATLGEALAINNPIWTRQP
ncbi:MAG: DUF6285 domain-containing protein [Porticoccaceae bacterium]